MARAWGIVRLMPCRTRGVARAVVVKCALLLFLGVSWVPASLSQEKLETPQQTNQRIQQLAGAVHSPTADYQINPGDLLRIDVFDVPDLSREVRVSLSGYITLPLIPVRIRAAGLTEFQLEEKIGELLQVNGLVTHPQVTVFVKEQHSEPIAVIGAVRSPLVVQAVRPITLLEALSRAGGIADDAGDTVIVTRKADDEESRKPVAQPKAEVADRPPNEAGAGVPAAEPTAEDPPEIITIRLHDLLNSGDPKFNIPLYGGDVVSVPRSGIVYVVGAVAHPGGFVLESRGESLSALKAIALAQGLTSTAKPHDAVIMRKNSESGPSREIPVDLKRILERKQNDVKLMANDVLFVPDSTGKRVLRRAGELALGITSGLVILRGGR